MAATHADTVNRLKRDENLRKYATERQWEILEAYWEHGTDAAAAKALGLSAPSQVHYARKRVLTAATVAGYITDPPPFVMRGLPAGFVLKGQSALVNREGQLMQRWDKTTRAGQEPEDARSLPDPKRTLRLSTFTDSQGKVLNQWHTEAPEAVAKEQAWRDLAKELAADLPRLDPVPAPEIEADHLMAGYPVGDHHFGGYSWAREAGGDWDLDKAAETLLAATRHLVDSMPRCETALIALLGDLTDYDGKLPVTPTHGNILDVDGRYHKMADVATATVRAVVDAALARHRLVRIVVAPGNHDPSTAVFLAILLAALYENEPRVTVDTTPGVYHYFEFGQNLIGVHHGDKVKRLEDLALIMATDRPEAWGRCKHRAWWTGHNHKDRVLDIKGVRIESFRVLPPANAWATEMGHRSVQAMRAIVLHKDHGEVQRVTFSPSMMQ